MRQFVVTLLVLVAFLAYTASPAAAQLVTGSAEGAFFKFAVPINWNGDLVIWNDGLTLGPIAPFTIDPTAPLAGLGPLAAVQFSEGFAVAVTSRRQIGWAVFKSNNDLHALMDEFVIRFGNPKRIFVTGGSF